MPKNKNKVSIKQKFQNGIKNKALNFMRDLTQKVGAEIYTELRTLRDNLNMSIDELLDDNKDVDAFYDAVTRYYNDYMKGVEE